MMIDEFPLTPDHYGNAELIASSEKWQFYRVGNLALLLPIVVHVSSILSSSLFCFLSTSFSIIPSLFSYPFFPFSIIFCHGTSRPISRIDPFTKRFSVPLFLHPTELKLPLCCIDIGTMVKIAKKDESLGILH